MIKSMHTEAIQMLALTSEEFLGLYNYWVVIFLMMTGFYIVIARKNMVKTIIGLNIFQTSVFLLYITMGKINHPNATAPIIPPHLVEEQHGHGHKTGQEHIADHVDGHVDESADLVEHASEAGHETANHAAEHAAEAAEVIYSNPLPSVLMLTAIVVGIATTALALALIVRIREDYGTIEEDEILLMDRQARSKLTYRFY